MEEKCHPVEHFSTKHRKGTYKWMKSMKGQSNHNLDSKGRLIIPARLRDRLGSSFVLCKGMDKNIYVYPEDEWEKFSEKLNSLPAANTRTRQFQRFFQGSAYDCEVDGQFRIVIPQKLREWAGIDKEVVLVGNGSVAEIWDVERWEKMNDPETMDIDAISMEMSTLYGF